MTNDKPTDYAAIIRAAQSTAPEPPEWLALGKHIYSPEYGVGEVMALLGKRLIVKFVEEVNPTQFADWEEAIAKELIKSTNTTLATETVLSEKNNANPITIYEQIKTIPQILFQSIAQELSSSVVAVDVKKANDGIIHPIPNNLPSQLQTALESCGIYQLYEHQVEALKILRAGYDLSIVTPTASGKTLCYNLPILEACYNHPQTTALFIFPLKALALDQMRKLDYLLEAIPDNSITIGLMTGDTSKEERQKLFIPHPPNILAVSPDLLHHFLYKVRSHKEGEGWRLFLKRLRYVVIDESHSYLGAFGAHFANLMRRLRLAVNTVGGNEQKLQFICSSATIGNPHEMALRFSGRAHQPKRLILISRSGAGSEGRTLLCLNPSSAANVDACKIIISWLQHNLTGIVFCNSRAAVKSLMGLIQRETQRQGVTHLASKIALFYSSLTSERRHEIIKKLQTGQIQVIISTSSLEAGIDLPELDCCLLRGFPGSLMSFWQRVGRAGRKQHGLVIYLPLKQNPIDVYYAQHPQQLLSGEIESAAFNPDYPTILGKHLECGCVESGINVQQINYRFGKIAGTVADSLLQQNKLFLTNHGTLWGQGYPHKEVNIRSTPNTQIKLIEKQTGEIIESMSLPLAQREVFPQAIYTVQDENGELISYKSLSLNPETGEAVLEYLGKDNDLFTEAESNLDIQPLTKLAEHKIIPTNITNGKLRLTLVWGEITTAITSFKLWKRAYGMTCKNPRCGNYKKSLEGKTCPSCHQRLHPAEVKQKQSEVIFDEPYITKYQAPCCLIEVNEPLKQALNTQVNLYKQEVAARYETFGEIPQRLKELWTAAPDFLALHSIQHQIIKAVPLVVLSSSLDVDGIVTEKEGRSKGYFFDTCDGGNGATEAIFDDLVKFASKAYALAAECNCEAGCPRCLHTSGCPQHNLGLYKDAGLFLLEGIGNGGVGE